MGEWISYHNLSFNHSPQYLVLSDAAHRVHPLAGLGVNLGFGDAACLHEILLTAAARGEEWGR